MSPNPPEKLAGPARLRLQGAGDERASVVELDEGPNSIGRGPENSVQIEHPTISEQHCVLEMNSGRAVLRDLGSTNGTFVDGERIETAELKSGQTLGFGEVRVVFECDTAVVTDTPATVDLSDQVPLEEAATVEPPAAQPQLCRCAQHPESRALWVCSDCGRWLCSRCVKHIPLDRDRRVTVCVLCNGLCEKVEEVVNRPGSSGSYGAGLISALTYPLRGTAVFLLIGIMFCAAIMAMLGMARPNPTGSMRVVNIFALLTGLAGYGSILLTVIGGSYLLLFFRDIVLTTVRGDAGPPAWPQFEMDTLGETVAQMLAWYLVAFGPATIWMFWNPGGDKTIGLVLLIAGAVYGPMALLGLIIYDSAAGLNPLLVLVSIGRAPVRYLLLCALVGALVGAVMGTENFLVRMGFLRLSQVIGSGLSAYSLMVALRGLGWFYRSTEDRLAWS